MKGKAREMAAAQKVADWQIAAILNIGQRAKHPLFVTNVDSTRLDDIAAWTYRAPVEDQARLGFAIANALDAASPAVEGLDRDLQNKVDVIVQALAGAKKPLIISGTNAGSVEMIQAAANVAKALKGRGADVGITMIARAVNSVGLGMIGGGSLDDALNELETGSADAVIVLENDLHRHASAARVDAALSKAPLVMVIDHQRTAIMDHAHLVLSTASFAESDGTVINNEGRAQRFFQVYDPSYYDNTVTMLESWRWLHSLHSTLQDRHPDWTQLDHVIDACIEKLPQLAGIKDAAPDATFRIRGQKLAREPHRYSGRTAMRANISVHEPRQPQDKDTMFSFSMEGNNHPDAPRSQVPFAWAPGWNSPQAWNKFQDEVGGHLRHGDPGVRLIEAGEGAIDYFTTVPQRFAPQDGQWRIAPYYHLFGSDEMSQRSPVFQSRMPQPYIRLNPADAAKLGVNAGAKVSFNYEGQTITLPLQLSEGLTEGQVGLPMGMPGIAPVMAGARLENLQEAAQ
ncbi:NADH-ubiquinone oxidoreductase chain G [Cronobacter dublinensis 582]|nr:NADH-ubiquinone oxidoreductase chain G [Cronobacter dublinensis 582]